jgi:hypothetical protein
MKKIKNPAEASAGFQDQDAEFSASPLRSAADLDTAERPLVTIPKALANPTAGRSLDIHRRAVGRRGSGGGNSATDNCAADDAAGDGCAEAALCAGGGHGKRTGDRCNRDEGRKCLLHVLGSPGDDGAPHVGAGFKVTHTLYPELTVSLESAQQSIQSKRSQNLGLKNGFFRPKIQRVP